MQYSFLLAPLLSLLSAFRMYLIAAGSAVWEIGWGMRANPYSLELNYRFQDRRGLTE